MSLLGSESKTVNSVNQSACALTGWLDQSFSHGFSGQFNEVGGLNSTSKQCVVERLVVHGLLTMLNR